MRGQIEQAEQINNEVPYGRRVVELFFYVSAICSQKINGLDLIACWTIHYRLVGQKVLFSIIRLGQSGTKCIVESNEIIIKWPVRTVYLYRWFLVHLLYILVLAQEFSIVCLPSMIENLYNHQDSRCHGDAANETITTH